MIWADHEHPQLCPIRHLLVYVFVAKIKSGNLFPSYDELRHPPDDGDFKTYLPYQGRYKQLCHQLFKRKGPFGTYSNRKSGYLFSVWADAELADIMRDVRHSTIANSQKYKKDAAYLRELLLTNNLQFTVKKCKHETKKQSIHSLQPP